MVVARRLPAARRAVRFIGGGRAVKLSDLDPTCGVVVLVTVSDSAVEAVARRLARCGADWAHKVVLHTCGSLSASALRTLRRRGAAIGALHPFQTIPNREAGVRNLVGCYWGFDGDGAARRVAARWVKSLRGVLFSVPPAQRALYHAAAYLACPNVITLMEHARRMLARVGLPEKIARPMLARFVAETAASFGRLGGRRALTGPVVRGDWKTIEGHLRALRRSAPDVIPLYRALLASMVRLAKQQLPPALVERRRGRIP